MGSKTSKLKDQIAKGILSGMGTIGLQSTVVQKDSFTLSPTESSSDLPNLSESVSNIPSNNRSDVKDDQGFVIQEPPPTLASPPESDAVLPSQQQTAPVLPSHTPPAAVSLSLTDSDLLRLTKDYLNREIRVKDRLWTGCGSKGLNKLKKIEGKIPEDMVDDIRTLSGAVTHHLERAVRLYLKVLKS